MVTFADGNANDANPNVDNNWVFTTGQTVGTNPATLVNYAFKPITTYETNVALRDGRNDNTLYALNSGLSDGTDGITINGTVYEFSRNFTFSAEISYVGQTGKVTTGVLVSRIVGNNGDTTAPLHGTAIVRFNDASINQIFNGPDGAGGADFSLAKIESVKLIANTGEQDRIVIQNRYDDHYPVICFAEDTEIQTRDGTLCVQDLRIGDKIHTRDNGLQTIRWIGARQITSDVLINHPHLRPIRICAGALGEGKPERALLVSPQHRILVRSKIAQKMFGTNEVLVAAKQLLSVNGIEIAADRNAVAYYHILFDRHEVIYANGAEAESLFTGPALLRSVSPEAREELLVLFPELHDPDSEMYLAPAARVLVAGRRGRQLARRHAANEQALVN